MTTERAIIDASLPVPSRSAEGITVGSGDATVVTDE
jgi:hypothetical protein